jgi:hypothetical protein
VHDVTEDLHEELLVETRHREHGSATRRSGSGTSAALAADQYRRFASRAGGPPPNPRDAAIGKKDQVQLGGGSLRSQAARIVATTALARPVLPRESSCARDRAGDDDILDERYLGPMMMMGESCLA